MRITIDVPAQEIAYQIIAAVEGGSGYWCHGFQLLESVAEPLESPWYACPFFWGTEGYRIGSCSSKAGTVLYYALSVLFSALP